MEKLWWIYYDVFFRCVHIVTVLDIYTYYGQRWNSVVKHLSELFCLFSPLWFCDITKSQPTICSCCSDTGPAGFWAVLWEESGLLKTGALKRQYVKSLVTDHWGFSRTTEWDKWGVFRTGDYEKLLQKNVSFINVSK